MSIFWTEDQLIVAAIDGQSHRSIFQQDVRVKELKGILVDWVVRI